MHATWDALHAACVVYPRALCHNGYPHARVLSQMEITIDGIGNNVSLVFERMDFGARQTAALVLRGRTPLEQNPITVRLQNADGAELTEIVEFSGSGGAQQRFVLRVPGGVYTVTYVFLPGSQFDFDGFRFEMPEAGAQ